MKVLLVQMICICLMHPWYECLSFIVLFHPYVSMGIGAQMGQLPARLTMSSLLTMIIGRYKVNVCLIVVQEELGFIYDGIPCYFVVRILKRGLYIYNYLDVVITVSHS